MGINIAVSGLNLNQKRAFIECNSILYLWPDVAPANASNKNITWSSSDTSIVTVDDNGIVYSKGVEGSSIITAVSEDGGFTATCEVIVQSVVVPVESISIIVPDITIYHYDYVQLSALVLPDNSTDKVVTWESSDKTIATIDSDGKLYANYFGTITITATTEDSQCSTKVVTAVDENGLEAVDEDGKILSDTIKVALSTSVTITILPVPVKGISFEELVYAVPVTNTVQVAIVFDPSNADNKNVTFYSSDTDTISVSRAGLVTGISGGSASVFAVSEDGGFTASCVIKVLGNYVPNVDKFKLKSVVKEDLGTRYSFTFAHDLLFLGGYELYYSYDKSSYKIAQFYADTNLQAISKRNDKSNFISLENEVCSISFLLTNELIIDGHPIYFRLRRISVNRRDKSSYTSIVTSYTFPSIPGAYADGNKLQVINENNKVILKFNNITISDVNSGVTRIVVSKNIMTEQQILSMDDDLSVECSAIANGDVVVVRDYRRQSLWCDRASDDNYLTLSDSNLLASYSHVYTDAKPPYVNNLKLYTESDKSFEVSIISDLSDSFYITSDTQLSLNSVVLYKVQFLTPDNSIYSQIECPVYVRGISSSNIYWRPLEASSNTILKNMGWKNMRDVLIDHHYYNKTTWDLPFSKNDCYDIRGYLGVANCYVDIYLNDVFNSTTTTDDYGNFSLRHYFPIGVTTISAVARTVDGAAISPKSSTLTIRTNYIYSWFAALSAQHSQIVQQNNLVKKQINVNTADETAVKNLYGKLTGLTIAGSESINDFSAYVRGVLPLYNNIGKDQAISDLIDLFEANVKGIDCIKYISNAKFEDIFVPGYSFITFNSSLNYLPRAKYKYTVTSCTKDQQETDGTSVDLDIRYSPQYKESQACAMLHWDPTPGASHYKIYRGVYDDQGICSSQQLLTLNGTEYTTFVDRGLSVVEGVSYSPPLYNVSALVNVNNLCHLNYYRMNSWENLLKKPNYFTILISMAGDSVMPEYLVSRFNLILRTITPAEQFYRIVVFNNSTISVYNTSASIISKITGLSVINS